MTARQRQAHAITDLASRLPKAQKIERLLGLQPEAAGQPLDVLEIGCSSGGIAHYAVISSHVIEHVGTAAEQRVHIREISLRPPRFRNYARNVIE